VLVHPDITFPSTPSTSDPLDPVTISKTENSQYSLFKELSSTLARRGHVLAVDTTHNLHWWAEMAPTFPDPVILVHSLTTGITSSHQKSISRLVKGIKQDLSYLENLTKNVPIAVTWDASLNACLNTGGATQDCIYREQLLAATDGDFDTHRPADVVLNEFTEQLGMDILDEIRKVDIGAWFFRTAKIQKSDNHRRDLVKRRVKDQVSGNDFLSMYKHGMFNRKSLSPNEEKKKKKLVPIALGLGAAGAGGLAGTLGYMYWDDIKSTADNLKQQLHVLNNEKLKPAIEGAKARLSPHLEGSKSRLSPHFEKAKARFLPGHKNKAPEYSSTGSQAGGPFREKSGFEYPKPKLSSFRSDEAATGSSLPPSDVEGNPPPPVQKDSAASLTGYRQTQGNHERHWDLPALSVIEEGSESEPISQIGEYETDYKPMDIDSRVNRGPWGYVDRSKTPSVDVLVDRFQSSSSSRRNSPSSAPVEISNQGSVAASVQRLEGSSSGLNYHAESPESSHRTPLSSEFGLSKGLTEKERKQLRPLDEIQRDLTDFGIPESEWAQPLNIRPPMRQAQDEDSRAKRFGKVFSAEEQKQLEEMLGNTRQQLKEVSKGPESSNRPSVKIPSVHSSLKNEKV